MTTESPNSSNNNAWILFSEIRFVTVVIWLWNEILAKIIKFDGFAGSKGIMKRPRSTFMNTDWRYVVVSYIVTDGLASIHAWVYVFHFDDGWLEKIVCMHINNNKFNVMSSRHVHKIVCFYYLRAMVRIYWCNFFPL